MTMSAPIHLVLRFDVEDFLLSDSDDATLRLARILDKYSVKGNFNITGKKVESLLEKGRTDVIRALKNHDVSCHSYDHSKHPMVREYSRDLGWHEGVAELIRRESPGIDLLSETFGARPSGYGLGGGNWTPHVFGAMREWDLPVYTSSCSYFRKKPYPTWCCGVLQMRTSLRTGDVFDLEMAKRSHEGSRRTATSRGGGLLNFLAHDCNYTTADTWDSINYMNGATPREDELKIPKPFSKKKQNKLFGMFEDYLRFILSFDDTKVVTPSDLPALFEDQSRHRGFGKEELLTIAENCAKTIDAQSLGNTYISAAEAFELLIHSTASFLERRTFPDKTHIKGVLGPVRSSQTEPTLINPPWHAFAESLVDAKNFLSIHNHIPSEILVGAEPVAPDDYLSTLACHFPAIINGASPAAIHVRKANRHLEDHIDENAVRLNWAWLDTQGRFQAPRLLELAKLQTWTLKPATLS